MTKRDDIQWLRALAIIAVVSFHLQPRIFPFGYLGVDIFFVISGYLMTSILSKSLDTLTFYLRRIKRIFPVYFLTITLFFVIGFFKLLPSHFDFLKAEVLWSIFFVNNFPPMLEKKEYFQMISEYKFFLHTWSLSVEIQFYLMAPFLIKFILSKNDSFHWTLSLAFLSCLLQTFIPNNAVAFGFVFCRIWQFLIGTLAFLYADLAYSNYTQIHDCDINYQSLECIDDIALVKVDENLEKEILQDSKNNDVQPSSSSEVSQNSVETNCIIIATFIVLLFICFNSFKFLPDEFEAGAFRLIATVLTGIFIVLNNSQPLFIPYFINSIFVYIGDLSYVIYLVHWPIIIYFKYFHITYGDIFILLCIFVSTLIVHECFEKPLGKLSWKYNIAAILLCFSVTILLCFIKKENALKSLNPIQLNQQEANSCGAFYYKDSCLINPIIEKYLVFRPRAEVLDRYCSVKVRQ